MSRRKSDEVIDVSSRERGCVEIRMLKPSARAKTVENVGVAAWIVIFLLAVPTLLDMGATGCDAACTAIGGQKPNVSFWVWEYRWMFWTFVGAFAIVVATVVLKMAMEKGDSLFEPTGQTLVVDTAGRVTGAWSLDLSGARAVMIEKRGGKSYVRVGTERHPRGVIVGQDDEAGNRAARVAAALSDLLGLPLADYDPTAVSENGAPLNCPKCRGRLVAEAMKRVTIDRCPSCRVVWLDGGELELIAGKDVMRTVGEESIEAAGRQAELKCPRDGDELGRRRAESLPLLVCPTCEGILVGKEAIKRLKERAKARRAEANARRAARSSSDVADTASAAIGATIVAIDVLSDVFD